MPRFDYKCPECGAMRYDVPADSSMGIVTCPSWHNGCWIAMEKLPAAPNFTVKGKFTAKNGYSNK